jgi:glutamine amidotransferase
MSDQSIVIVDSGASNVRGINNVVRQLGINSLIANSPKDLASAKKIILPGVGAFDAAMTALKRADMVEAIQEHALSGTHILGICLGMQLLVDGSAEGIGPGLGLIQGFVEPIKKFEGLRVPHLGWNNIRINQANPLVSEEMNLRFYFNHSFALYDIRPEASMLSVEYGDTFTAGIKQGNVFGVQFHPEKSHNQGRLLIKRFIEYSNENPDRAL